MKKYSRALGRRNGIINVSLRTTLTHRANAVKEALCPPEKRQPEMTSQKRGDAMAYGNIEQESVNDGCLVFHATVIPVDNAQVSALLATRN